MRQRVADERHQLDDLADHVHTVLHTVVVGRQPLGDAVILQSAANSPFALVAGLPLCQSRACAIDHQHTFFVPPRFGSHMSTRRSFLRPSSSLALAFAIVLP